MDQNLLSSLFEYSYTVVIVGLLYYFLRTSFKKSGKQLLLHWILFGFIVNAYGLSWLYTAYPLEWMRPGVIQLFALGALHLILSVSTALSYTPLALARHKKIPQEFLPLVFASLLVIAEVGRALIISMLYYKEGTATLGLHFTAGTIGNALSTTPLIEFAYFGGTFALTFVLGYLVYVGSSKQHVLQYWKHALGIMVVLVCVHFFIPAPLPKEGTSIGIITTNFTLPKNVEGYGEAFKEQEKKVHDMTLQLASSSPSFIVYPEDTRYITNLTPSHKTDLLILFGNTLFIDGDTIPTKNGYSNVSLFYYPKRTKISVRGKEFLLPFNEYLPLVFESIFKPFVPEGEMESYTKLHTYASVVSDKTVIFNKTRIGTLLCSEILSFSVVNALKKENPDIVFFQSRMNVFHNNIWTIMHMRSFTKVAATQLRKPFVSSISGAPSFVISPHGKMLLFIPTGLSSTIYTFK